VPSLFGVTVNTFSSSATVETPRKLILTIFCAFYRVRTLIVTGSDGKIPSSFHFFTPSTQGN
jgi:hypothetical protein